MKKLTLATGLIFVSLVTMWSLEPEAAKIFFLIGTGVGGLMLFTHWLVHDAEGWK